MTIHTPDDHGAIKTKRPRSTRLRPTEVTENGSRATSAHRACQPARPQGPRPFAFNDALTSTCSREAVHVEMSSAVSAAGVAYTKGLKESGALNSSRSSRGPWLAAGLESDRRAESA